MPKNTGLYMTRGAAAFSILLRRRIDTHLLSSFEGIAAHILLMQMGCRASNHYIQMVNSSFQIYIQERWHLTIRSYKNKRAGGPA